MPLKYMLATRTSSARDFRFAGGVSRSNASRGCPRASKFFAPMSLWPIRCSTSVMRPFTTLRRAARITLCGAGLAASRMVMSVTICPAVGSAMSSL